MISDLLKTAFGLSCNIEPIRLKSLPVYMTAGRKLYKVSLGGETFMLAELSEKDRFGAVALKKQMNGYYEKTGMNVAFCVDDISRVQRDAFVEKGIPFVALPDQIYLPFLGLMLSNNFKKKLALSADKMMPATQCVFLYLLYNGNSRPVIKKQAAEDLGLTKTSITRASEQLKAMGLISEKKTGRETEMIAVASGLELYERAKAYLIKPVQRSFFINVSVPVHGFKAGESALSDQSMLGKPKTDVLAVYKGSKDVQSLQEIDPRWNEGPAVMIELWKYDPGLFAKNGTVDPVSLAMSLSDNEDERVQGELQDYLEGYKW